MMTDTPLTPSSPFHELCDGQLLARYHQFGDQRAFGELVSRHAETVFRVARWFMHDRHLAEDVTQQAFATLAEQADSPSLIDRVSLEGWLRRTAWQIAARSLRAAQTRSRHETYAATLAADTLAAMQAADDSDTAALVRRRLAALPEPYRQALVLYYFEGHSVAEVARRTNHPVGTIAARISRARDLLRESLPGDLLGIITAFVVMEVMRADASGAPGGASWPGFVGRGPTPPAVLSALRRRFPKLAAKVASGLGMFGTLSLPARAAVVLACASLAAGGAGAAGHFLGPLIPPTFAPTPKGDPNDGRPSQSPKPDDEKGGNNGNSNNNSSSSSSSSYAGGSSVPEPTALPLIALPVILSMRRSRAARGHPAVQG